MANNSVRYPTELRERAVRMVLEASREGCIRLSGRRFVRWRRCWVLPRRRCVSGFESPGSRFGTVR